MNSTFKEILEQADLMRRVSKFITKHDNIVDDGCFVVHVISRDTLYLTYYCVSNPVLTNIKALMEADGWKRETTSTGATSWVKTKRFHDCDLAVNITLANMEQLPTEVPVSAWPIMLEDTKA